jgi:hypothetical protein
MLKRAAEFWNVQKLGLFLSMVLAPSALFGSKISLASGPCEKNLMSTTYQRFMVLLSRIKKDGEKAGTVEERIQSYLQNDTRGNVFRVEGMLRLFAQNKDYQDDFKGGYEKSEAFEDALGKYADSLKFQKRAIKSNWDDLSGVIANRVSADHQALNSFLEERWDQGQEDKWKEKYEKRFKDFKGQAERNFVFTELLNFIDDFRKIEWDFNVLQKGGIHEYRRKLRWVLLMTQASGGLFKLKIDPAEDERYSKYIKGSGVRESDFSKIEVLFPEKNPCYISRGVYEMLTLAVFQIGTAKDSGELVENLKEAYLAVNKHDEKAAAKARKLAETQPDFIEPKPLAEKWKKVIEDEKILEQFFEQVKACIKE